MANNNEIAKAYVQIVPTATGISDSLSDVLNGESADAGRQSGQSFTSGFAATTKSAAQAFAPVSGAAQGFLKDIIATSAGFDESMSRVQAISGASGQDLQDLRDLALDLGRTTRFTASDVAGAMESMGMASWKAEDMVAGMPDVLHLAAAAGEDLGTTSDIVTDNLTAFGLTANDAWHFVDVLAAAATNSNTNVSMMGDSFRYAAALAGTLGYSADDVAIALGLMANSGIKSGSAGVALRNIIKRMVDPTDEAAASMEALGISLDDGQGNMYSFHQIMDQLRSSIGGLDIDMDSYQAGVEDLNTQLEAGQITQEEYDDQVNELAETYLKAADAQKASHAANLAGAYGLAGLLAIVNATDEDYQGLTDVIYGSSNAMAYTKDGGIVPLSQAIQEGAEIVGVYQGQAEAMAAVMEDNLNGSIRGIESRFESLKIELGDKIMPLLETGADYVIKFLDWFNGLDEGTQTLIVGVVGITAVITPLLTGLSSIAIAIGALTAPTSLLTTTIIPAVTGGFSTLATTAIPALQTAFGTLVTAAGNVVTALGGIPGVAAAAVAAVVGFYDVKTLNDAANTYNEAHQAHLSEVENALSSYEQLYNEKGKATADSWAQTVYQIDTSNMSLEEAQSALVSRISDLWGDAPENMWQGFKGGVDHYFGSGEGGGVVGLAKDAFSGFIDSAMNLFGIASPSKVMEDIGENVMAGYVNGIQGNSWNLAMSVSTQQLEQLKNAYAGLDQNFETTGANAAIALANGLANGSHNLSMALRANSVAMQEWVMSFNGMAVQLESVGQNLMVGLANGIIESGRRALQAVVDTARAIINAARDVFSVASPSKVFEQIGEYLPQGLALGVEASEDKAVEAVRRMSGATINAAFSARTAQPVQTSETTREDRMYALLEHYLPMFAQMEVVLNGAVVGQMAPGMDTELGNLTYYKNREVLV